MRLVLLFAACLCFVIGLLLALGVFHGDTVPWLFGGLLAFVLSFLPVERIQP